MSIQVALDNIGLKPSHRWGHTEYSLGYHTVLLERYSEYLRPRLERQ